MAYQPNDPFRGDMTEDEIRHQARLNSLDNELQPDPELAEGPASGAKVAMFAIAIAVVLGAVFYGLNNTTVNQAGTTPPSQTAQTQPANPAAASRHARRDAEAQQRAWHDHAARRPIARPRRSPIRRDRTIDPSANPPASKHHSPSLRLTLRSGPIARCFLLAASTEHLVEFAAGKAVGEFVESPLLRHFARGLHEAGPGGARERAADADAADAEISGFLDRQSGGADQQIDRLWMHRLHHR